MSATGWHYVVPAGALAVPVPAGPRARAELVRRLAGLASGAPVALLAGRPGSRRRLHAVAAAAGVSVEREYLALPSLRSALFVVEDEPATVGWFARTLLAVPPGTAALAGPGHLGVRLARRPRLAPWLGRLAPGRILVGRRR